MTEELIVEEPTTTEIVEETIVVEEVIAQEDTPAEILCEDEEEYVVPTIECPPNKVPGWLDENGNPQGCVDNNPNPGQPKEEPGTVVPENPAVVVPEPIETVTTSAESSPQMLAETGGVDPLMGGFLAVALLGAGILMLRKGRRLSDVK